MAILAGLFGWLFAAIINYIADVLPLERKFALATCGYCKSAFPLTRYLFLGRCEKCGKKLSRRHYIATIGLILLSILNYYLQTGTFQNVFFGFLVLVYFTSIIIIDIEHHLILHIMTLTGAVLMGGIGTIVHGLFATIVGGSVGIGVMMVLYLLGIAFGKYISKRRGQDVDDGLGFGDVTLAGVCGLLLGWPGISLGLFFGIMIGGVYSLGILVSSLIRKQYSPFRAIPYGPFLALSAILIWMIR